MSKQYVEIYYVNDLQETLTSISSYNVAEDYTAIVWTDGTAASTSVSSGGNLTVSGGTATETTVKNGGFMRVNSGLVTTISVRAGGALLLNGEASGIKMQGNLTVDNGGIASDCSLYTNAFVTVNAGGVIKGEIKIDSRKRKKYTTVQTNGTVNLSGGTASIMEIDGGLLVVGAGALASQIYQNGEGGVVQVLSGGNLDGLTCEGAVVTVAGGGAASNTTLKYCIEEGMEGTEIYTGRMTLASGAVHRGTLTIDSKSTLTAETGAVIDFTVSACTPGNTALISDISRISGTPSYTLTVNDNQQTGSYALAGNTASFSAEVTVQNTTGTQLGTVSTGKSLVLADYAYSLQLADSQLSLSVTDSPYRPHDLTGTANGTTWQSTASAFTVQYSTDNFGSVLAVETASCGVDTYAMPQDTYQWQVKASEGTVWSTGSDIVSTYEPEAGVSKQWTSDQNGKTDLFFANANGTWTAKYAAKNLGSIDDWDGTSEKVSLSGKNQLTDIFSGSTDANVLVMTDDTCGDALFLDDIYSAFPSTEQCGRIANLDEIRAGAGDDVVDMTSQRFAYAGDGVTVRGGSGNDTIWANKGSNLLLGDDGSDRLVGASGNDVLAGGNGSDSMHGGGGSDIFCFCENWGIDTIEQTEDGTVTLWFKDTVELTFEKVGDNTLITSSQGTILAEGLTLTSDNCRFGATGYEDEFAKLSAAGAFESESSTSIFAEEK